MAQVLQLLPRDRLATASRSVTENANSGISGARTTYSRPRGRFPHGHDQADRDPRRPLVAARLATFDTVELGHHRGRQRRPHRSVHLPELPWQFARRHHAGQLHTCPRPRSAQGSRQGSRSPGPLGARGRVAADWPTTPPIVARVRLLSMDRVVVVPAVETEPRQQIDYTIGDLGRGLRLRRAVDRATSSSRPGPSRTRTPTTATRPRSTSSRAVWRRGTGRG